MRSRKVLGTVAQLDLLDAAGVARALRELLATAASEEAFVSGLTAFATELRAAGEMPVRSLVRTLARAATAETYLETLHEVRSLLSGVSSSVEVGAELVRELFSGRVGDPEKAEKIAALLDCVEDAKLAADHAVMLAGEAIAVRATKPASLRLCVEMAARITRHARLDATARVVGEIPDVRLVPTAGAVLQVLLNLLRNAQEAVLCLPEPEVRVTAWTSGGMAFVCVEDNGPGFADAPPPGQSSKPSGAGVGLRVSRSLAESWGGSLELEGRQGGGACAIFSVPVDGE